MIESWSRESFRLLQSYQRAGQHSLNVVVKLAMISANKFHGGRSAVRIQGPKRILASMRRTQTLCAVALLLLLTSTRLFTAESPNVLTLDDSNTEYDLSSFVTYVEDNSTEWTLEQAIPMLQAAGQQWQGPGFPVVGFSYSAYWASVTVDNNLAADSNWFARMEFSSIDQFDFFYQDSSGDWQQKKSGDTLPFDSRDVNHHTLMFSFPLLASTQQTLYFRFQTNGSVQMPLRLLSESTFQDSRQTEMLIYGLYFGMMIVIGVYSALMFVATRDKAYLSFMGFILFGAMYSFSFQGLAFQYLWPLNPGWANLFFVGLAGATGLQFARDFLNVATLDHRLDKAMFWLIGLAILYSVLSLIVPYGILSRAMSTFVMAMLGLMSIAAYLSVKNGSTTANYFLVAWIALMFAITAELLQRLGVSVPPELSYHGIQIGSVLAALVLSLGLGDRIRLMLIEYNSVQEDMLKANQQKIDALHKADNVKEEFIANVSHELRTPLTGIIGLSEIMLEKRGDALSENDRETLTMIKVSGQRLSNLVNDIIDFTAIKNGRLEMQTKTVDLKQICKMVVKMCVTLIGNKKVQLKENYPHGPVNVNGDEDRLQQVLFNLVSNAIKFTSQGSVTLKIEILDVDARVSVQDTGIGISLENQKKIFNRFYQVDSAESRQEGGTGLGLAISQRLVELHGTEIILRSKPGEGSLFFFDLPVVTGKPIIKPEPSRESLLLEKEEKRSIIMDSKPAIQQRRAVEQDVESQGLISKFVSKRDGKILVVDDEYLNLRIVEEHLSEDYTLTTALSGHEALELLEKDKPDVIIMDLMMPVMTGFELCQHVRKRYRLDELPVIILTAKNRVEDLVRGLSVGANDYITKPFSKEELKVRVKKQFELLQLIDVKEENQRLNWTLEKYQESEQRLREKENRLAKMLDVTTDAMICVDESGVIVYVNKAAESLFDVSSVDYHERSLNVLANDLGQYSGELAAAITFPFEEEKLSEPGNTKYFYFQLNSMPPDEQGSSMQRQISFCILPLSLEQELYLLTFSYAASSNEAPALEDLNESSLPQIIDEINKNVERTQLLQDYLNKITPEALQQHSHLFEDLRNVDAIIQHMSDSLPKDDDLQYREALVKLMQECHYYWQKITGESIIELAEKSRIWSVSIDNGRLRTRSMNRYLSLDKLPSNPRWRQVARTAYFVLSKVSHDDEAKRALEKSVARLQDIVETKALN